MAGINRSTLINKLRTVLRKHFKPHPPLGERSLLQHLLLACCLEGSGQQSAEDALAAISEMFFDWNEVRVTTTRELAEVMKRLSDPQAAALRLRKCLQNVFEQTYSFDIESLKKQGLGQAAKRLAEFGASPFAVSYVTQHGLGGHAIPLDAAALEIFELLGLISPKERAAGSCPGLERAVPKNKGIEFSSLLQQLVADFAADRYSPAVHAILLEVNPAIRDRLPRKPTKKELAAAAAEAEAAKQRVLARRAAAAAAAEAAKSAQKGKTQGKPAPSKAEAKPAPKREAPSKEPTSRVPPSKVPPSKEPLAKQPPAKEAAKDDGKSAKSAKPAAPAKKPSAAPPPKPTSPKRPAETGKRKPR